MKVTASEFEFFKKCCAKWIRKLGLTNWAVYYYLEEVEGSYAQTAWDFSGMAASIRMGSEWDGGRPKNRAEIDRLALHECLHLLLAPLIREAEARYADEDIILSSEHSIIRSIENSMLDTKE